MNADRRRDNTVNPTDDGSSEPAAPPSALDLGGTTHTPLYPNNNGNATFDEPPT